jgi:hypothetical protein
LYIIVSDLPNYLSDNIQYYMPIMTIEKRRQDQKIEELTDIMVGEFDKMYVRFDTIDEESARVRIRFDKIDDKFIRVYNRFDDVDQKFVKVDQKFTDLTEIMLREFDKVYVKMDNGFAELDLRIGRLEARMERFDVKMDILLNHFKISIPHTLS